jgi:peptide/nickel transport system permease protein
MLLGLISLFVAFSLAFAVGLVAVQRPGGVIDNFLSTGILFVLGLPSFVVGLVVIYIFAAWLRLLPPDSTALDIGSSEQQIEAFILPVMTLSIILTPYIARMVRSNVREVLATPYIQSALMRGVRGWRLFANHVIPNALGPAINVVALSLAEVLTGVVVVENVFGFPGLGQLTVAAIGTEDIAVLQICVLLAAVGFVTINLLADALVVGLNPRLRRRQA